MASGGRPPDTLNTRHETAAMLLATGLYTNADVAERVGYSINRLSIIKQSPDFQTLVEKFKARFQERALEDAVQIVMEDTKKNVEFLQSVRDGEELQNPEDPKVLPSRIRASEILFDRQMPRRQQMETQTGVTIKIESRVAERLDQALLEDGVIEVEATESEDT